MGKIFPVQMRKRFVQKKYCLKLFFVVKYVAS